MIKIRNTAFLSALVATLAASGVSAGDIGSIKDPGFGGHSSSTSVLTNNENITGLTRTLPTPTAILTNNENITGVVASRFEEILTDPKADTGINGVNRRNLLINYLGSMNLIEGDTVVRLPNQVTPIK